MEFDNFRKKVYIQTLYSSFIEHRNGLQPTWISQNQLIMISSYDFTCYNLQDQSTRIIPRQSGQNQIIAVNYRSYLNEDKCEIYYIFCQDDKYYLAHRPQEQLHNILIYQNIQKQKQKYALDFIDQLFDKSQQKSQTQLFFQSQFQIDEIETPNHLQEKEKSSKNVQKMNSFQVKSVKQLLVIFQCNFALLIVETNNTFGILIVDIERSSAQKQQKFFCPTKHIRSVRFQAQQFSNICTKCIFLFPDPVCLIRKSKDFTRLFVLTSKYLYLCKINYQNLQMEPIYKYDFQRNRQFIISFEINKQKQQQYLVATVKPNLESDNIQSSIAFFIVQNDRIIQCYSKYQQNTIKFQGAPPVVKKKKRKLKNFYKQFIKQQQNNSNDCDNLTQIKQKQDRLSEYNKNVFSSIFSNMVKEQRNSKIIHLPQKQSRKSRISVNSLGIVSITDINDQPKIQDRTVKQIGGFCLSQDIVLVWQKNEPVIHLCQILSVKQQKQIEMKTKQHKQARSSLQDKQQQIKEIFSQLIGVSSTTQQKQNTSFEPELVYITKIQLSLSNTIIKSLSISPSNYNILIVSQNLLKQQKNIEKQHAGYYIFQLQLFRQLMNADPNVFLKQLPSNLKNKPIQTITTSITRENALFMAGNLVFNSQNQLLQGVLSFDIHPYNYYLAASFGFTMKVYAIQGEQKLTSLFSVNGSAVKLLKYSPLGNHLCIMYSKSIKIVDAYSYSIRFTINQKNNNFSLCCFNSTGSQFYTITQNHIISVYNTIEYTKIDQIKPITFMDFRPISIKLFNRISQYCIVMDNGTLFAKYKQNIPAVHPQAYYKYQDKQKITCMDLDQKNNVIFIGCNSGKIRIHMWPINESHDFQKFTQIRSSYSSVTSLCLSHLGNVIYIGNANGNIAKMKYVIDKQRMYQTRKDNQSLFADNNFRFFVMQTSSNIQKIYKYRLLNGSNTNEDSPQKIRLQFKLSEVIQKLNEEMKKLKGEIKNELKMKGNENNQKIDLNLIHHLHKMISSKIHAQIDQQRIKFQKQIQQIIQESNIDMNKQFQAHSVLVQQKSKLISQYHIQKNEFVIKLSQQYNEIVNNLNKMIEQKQNNINNCKQMVNMSEVDLYILPNNTLQDNKEYVNELIQQNNYIKNKIIDLRNQCTYKSTAIKQFSNKKIKQESLQFKVKLEIEQMSKKLQYTKNIINQLKNKINKSQGKLYKMQTESVVMKSGAQFKKQQEIDQMNDACSFLLYLKDKLQNQISDYTTYLKKIQETLQSKGNYLVDAISIKFDKQLQIQQKRNKIAINKTKLKTTRNKKLDLTTRVNNFNAEKQIIKYKNKIKNPDQSKIEGFFSPRQDENKYNSLNSSKIDFLTSRPNKNILIKTKQDLNMFENLLLKQKKVFKTNVKIHQRKINKINKQNGQLLHQFQKLKYQNKLLKEEEFIHKQQIQNTLFKPIYKTQKTQIFKKSFFNHKTPFQKYTESKNGRFTNKSTKFQTCTTTPLRCLSISPPHQD